MNVVLIGIFVYILAQLLIGVLVSRRIKTEADYMLAGRSLGYGLATFSIFATWFGAESCIGAAGKVYEEGLSGSAADPFGYGLCLILMGLVFAVPLWRRGFTTLADLFQVRYSKGVERIAVLMMVPTSVMWAAAQMRAFGQVLEASSELGLVITITIAALVVVIYTVYGGLRADAITDIIQGLALIVGIVIIFVVFTNDLGGMDGLAQAIKPERLHFFGNNDKPLLATLETWAVPVLGSVVAQEMVTRLLAARSPEIARRASLMGGGLYILVGLMPVTIALAAFSVMPGIEDSEQILPLIAQKYLSDFLYILFAGALVSAILSTVDSALLAAASLTSHNLILPLRPDLSEQAKVRLARIGVIVFGVVAYALALSYEGIYELVYDASAFGGAGIFIIVCFGLFTRCGGVKSAYAALGVGAAVWFYGNYIADLPYTYISSIVFSLGAYLLVALMEGRKAAGLDCKNI